ncbi:MAG: hypothetical protein COB02_18580, partial [Candidatus Cloacimonadota bacterium]
MANNLSCRFFISNQIQIQKATPPMARKTTHNIFPSFIRKMFKMRESNSFLSKRAKKQDTFLIEGLEERTMLSADPILGAGYAALVQDSNHSTKTIDIVQKIQKSIKIESQATKNIIDLTSFLNDAEVSFLESTSTLENRGSVQLKKAVFAPDIQRVIHNALLPKVFKAALNSNQSQAGDITIGDSITITGDISMTAGTGGSGNITLGTSSSHTLNGDGAVGNDTLTLNANAGNILIKGVLGGSDSLEAFTVIDGDGTSAGVINISFDSEVTMNGDVNITATGTVTFNKSLNITGNLTILGANLIIFEEGVSVSGNIILEGDEINFKGGEESIKISNGGSGSITMRSSTITQAMSIASPPSEESSNVLNITSSELTALGDGFTKIIFGHFDSGDNHAVATAGAVEIGMRVADQITFRDEVIVYGGSISIADYSGTDKVLKASGNITLDAVNNIEIKNEIEATSANMIFYSESGKISQINDTKDGLSSESLRANDLTVTASTGIDLGFTEITNLTASNTGDGHIIINVKAVSADVNILSITQTNAVFAGNTTITTENGNIVVATAGTGISTVGTGNITLDANDTGTDKTITVNKVISATTGTILLTSDGDITSTQLISNSGNGAITLTSAQASINQQANISSVGGLIKLQAQGTSGIITMTDGVTTSSVSGALGDVRYESSTNILLSKITGAATVTLIATAGSITDNLNGETANILGGTTVLNTTSKNGVGTSSEDIDTQVASFSANNSTSGGVYIEEIDSLEINATNILAAGTDGTISLKALDGEIVVSGTISSTGDVGNVILYSLEASGDVTNSNITISKKVSSTKGDISIISSDNITQNADGDIQVDASSKTIDVSASLAITMVDGATSITNNSNIRYEASSSNIALASLNAGDGDITIKSGGNISDAGNTDVDLISVNLRLEAGGTIGSSSESLDTTVTTLAAKTAGGGIFINETDVLIINKVNAISVNRVGGAAVVDSASMEDITTLSNGSIVISATDLEINAGTVTAASAISSHGAGNILLQARSVDIDLNASIDGGSGHISLVSATNINLVAAGDMQTTAGSVDIEATAGLISMLDGASINSGSGNIRLLASTTLTLGTLITSSHVSLIADSISDSGTTDIDVSANRFRVKTTDSGSSGFFGTSSNHIETTVATLSANVGSGGLFITESDSLILDTVSDIVVNRVKLDGSVTASIKTDVAQSNVVTTGALV